MDEDTFLGNELLVQIAPPLSEDDVDNEYLAMYLENTFENGVQDLKYNSSKTLAIVKMENPVYDIKDLQRRIKEKCLADHTITFLPIPPWNKILVTDLPSEFVPEACAEPHDSKLLLYFESKRFCPDGGEVTKLDILPCHHAVVIHFKEPDVLKRLKADHCFEEKQFRVRPLEFFEYVEEPLCSICELPEKETGESGMIQDDEENYAGPTQHDSSSSDNDLSTTEKDELSINIPCESDDENSESLKEKSSTTPQHEREDNPFGGVCLSEYTEVADKLNCTEGKKWIENLLNDLKLQVKLTKSVSNMVVLQGINTEVAKEAANAIANSLLPAKIQCKQLKKDKCSKILEKRILVWKWHESGWLELKGMPLHVIETVGELEQTLLRL